MISAGLLRWTATVMQASASQDALGLRADSWSAGATFRCDLRNLTASEQPYADGIAVRQSYEIRARWPAVVASGINAVDRISVRGKTLRVNAIRNLDEADRVAVIDCEEVV